MTTSPLDRITAWLTGAVVLVLIVGYATLVALDRPTDGFTGFVTGPLVSGIVALLLSRLRVVLRPGTEPVPQTKFLETGGPAA